VTKNSTVAITVFPGRENYAYNAVLSAMTLSHDPLDIFVIFNNFQECNSNKFIDFLSSSKISFTVINDHRPLSFLWNLAVKLSNTESVLICNDDVLFNDKQAIEKILIKHNEGYGIVKAAENYSGFSILKESYKLIGEFDEQYLWSWEDFDYTIRAAQNGVRSYLFEPSIIEHLRASGNRREDLWTKSGQHFFKKWKLKEKFPELIEHENDPEEIKKLLFSGFFHGGLFLNGGLFKFFDEIKKHV
jgi:hypothetical protein